MVEGAHDESAEKTAKVAQTVRRKTLSASGPTVDNLSSFTKRSYS